MKVAYLVSQYPAISHAFIEREVAELRKQGWQVETFSVNAPGEKDLRSRASRADAATTTILLESRSLLLRCAGGLAARHPVVAVQVLIGALTTGPRTLRGRMWQVCYLVEAALLVRRLRDRGIRHIHVHFANNGADIARTSARLGRLLEGPTAGWGWSMSMHGPTEFDDPKRYDLAEKVRDAAFVACISTWCRAALLALVPEVGPRLSIVRMTVDVERYPPLAEGRLNRSGNAVVVLFVGRLVPEKAPDLLIEAVAQLRSEGIAVRLRVVGSGPLAGQLAEKVERLGLSDAVEFCGPRGQDELPQLYGEADVFCLPSRSEGLPVVLMEAASSELPVLTTRITGIPELVVDDVTGLLVEPGDLAGLTAGLRRLVEDPFLRARLGRGARVRVLQEFLPGPNATRLGERLRQAQRML